MRKKAETAPFRNTGEHLAAELGWLNDALLALVRSTRTGAAQPGGHGWFISTEEAELLLTSDSSGSPHKDALAPLQRKRKTIADRRRASAEQGIPLALPRLARMFRLSPVEELLLVASLAAELEDRYGRIYGYLHDDLTRKYPSIQLIARLSRLDPSFGTAERLILASDTPLFRWQLVCCETNSPLARIARGWWADQRIAAFLLEQVEIDVRIGAALRTPGAVHDLNPSVGVAEIEHQIWNLVEKQQAGLIVHFHGPGAGDGEQVARRICRRIGIGLIHADLALLLDVSQSSGMNFVDGVRRLYREALLQTTAVYVSGIDLLRNDPRANAHVQAFEDVAQEVSWFTFVEGELLWLPHSHSPGISCLPVHLAAPSYEVRRDSWRVALSNRVDPAELDALAARYRLAPRNIQRAVQLAKTRADARRLDKPEYADLIWACRLHSKANLDGIAQTIAPRAHWKDLVLPEDDLRQLQEICAHARCRAKVLHEWGFDRTLSLGKGLYALFVGPSGTGKTLAAEVLANALEMDLIKVDLSAVVSKYIGETEKNLQRAFDVTEQSDAILFFDEADAIFGKRSEIRDAHDRYANIEVSFLLQRLETYEGFVILASNLAQNIDDSFSRRMQFMVEFPFPSESARFAIWRRHLPPETPVADDVDLAWLSREFKIAGGNIRNVVLNAAFMAADDGGKLQMRHLLRATEREYARLGIVYRFQRAAGAKEACA